MASSPVGAITTNPEGPSLYRSFHFSPAFVFSSPFILSNPSGNAGELSQMIKVSGLQFRRQTPNYFQDWHTAPRRQYVITLSGHGEVELAGGKKVPLDPGHILLAEDVTGRGHISRGVGTEDRLSLFIPVAE